MRTAEYIRRSKGRIARAETEAAAAIGRAITKALRALEHERMEYLIFKARKAKGVRG